jgi:hypothetical protein
MMRWPANLGELTHTAVRRFLSTEVERLRLVSYLVAYSNLMLVVQKRVQMVLVAEHRWPEAASMSWIGKNSVVGLVIRKCLMLKLMEVSGRRKWRDSCTKMERNRKLVVQPGQKELRMHPTQMDRMTLKMRRVGRELLKLVLTERLTAPLKHQQQNRKTMANMLQHSKIVQKKATESINTALVII